MWKFITKIVVVQIFILCSRAPAEAALAEDPPRLTVAEIVARCEPSVAVIEGKRGGGTGFLVRRRLLVTNAHVIAHEPIDDLRVRFPSANVSKQGPFPVEPVAQDRERDLAFLAVKTELAPLPLATAYKYTKGDDVLVIGSPGTGHRVVLENAVSRGIMSARTSIDGQDFYQLNIAINGGNSGGPVFDMHGKVIGVVTLKLAQREGIAMCIPVERLIPQVTQADRQMRSVASGRPAAISRTRPSQPVARDDAPIKRQPKPDDKAIENARTELRALFKAELKQAVTADQQSELSEKLFDFARDTEGDAAAQYALFDEARELAARAGMLEPVLRILDAMRESFDGFDSISLDVETLERVARHVKLGADRIDLARAALDRVDLAIERDNFEGARRLIDLAKQDKKSLPTVGDDVKSNSQLVESLSTKFQEIKRQIRALEEDPEDPEANLTVGTYRVLWKGDWDQGLPMLAKGGPEPLAEIARRDLANPEDPADQGSLGDSWWDVGAKLPARPRSIARARAVMWYDRCVESLTGLAKVRTRKRLEEYAAAAEDSTEADRTPKTSRSGAGRPGLVAEFFEGQGFQRRLTWRIDPVIDFNWGDGSPDPAVPKDFFGARWTGYLRAPAAGTYTLKLKSDNGLRWVIGDRVVYDKLSVNGQHNFEVTLDLKAGMQPMRVDFLEGIFTSWCHLSWRRPGRAEFEPIPADCFSHTRDQEPARARR